MADDSNSPFAFVLMPFDKKFDDVYHLGVKETAKALGIIAQRVDEQIYREGMLERIYRQIELADIIIADMSGKNPNVFYEVGYAHAKEKLCILLTSDAADIPFDLQHRRHIVYGNSIQILRDQLSQNLAWAKKEIATVNNSRIKVALRKPASRLEKTRYLAIANIDFTIDLNNDSDQSSAELEAIYFYSTKGWEITQDGKTCQSTQSDIPHYAIRHFLSAPVRRIQKGSWAPLAFKAVKTLASAFAGEELKDSYLISGTSILRLVTSQGTFDYEVMIETTVDEIPF